MEPVFVGLVTGERVISAFVGLADGESVIDSFDGNCDLVDGLYDGAIVGVLDGNIENRKEGRPLKTVG